MKKRFLALGCIMVLVMAMGLSAQAAGSVTTPAVTENPALKTGTQQLNENTIKEFAEKTKVESDVDVVIGVVTTETAGAMVTQAKQVVGDGAFIATMVDIQVPAGTKSATFTIKWSV